MKIAYFAFFLLLLIILKPVHSQRDCPCDDASSGASWGRFVGVNGNCEGRCDRSIREETRICTVQFPDDIRFCQVISPCVLLSSCTGSWSQWSNVEACSASCGGGTRRQTRICYLVQNGRQTNRRNRYCLGGMGDIEQERFDKCRTNQCPATSTTIATATTTTTTTTTTTQNIATTTSTATATMTTVDVDRTSSSTGLIHANETTEARDENPRRRRRPRQPRANVLVLATVLGSVAIVCIAVIIIVVIFVKRRKSGQNRTNGTSPQTAEPSAPPLPLTTLEDQNNYETIPPALPPLRKISKNPPETPRAVPNVLYQPQQDQETSLQVPRAGDETYLEPIPSPIPSRRNIDHNALEEATYVSVDEYNG